MKNCILVLLAFALFSPPLALAEGSIKGMTRSGELENIALKDGKLSLGYGSTIAKILPEGLERVTSIELTGVAYLNDFSFLKAAQNLEKLTLFEVAPPDYSFFA